MSEIKTLKDIEFKDYHGFKETPITAWEFMRRKLKAEAIKWIKDYEGIVGIDWKILFKNFHNITLKDLK